MIRIRYGYLEGTHHNSAEWNCRLQPIRLALSTPGSYFGDTPSVVYLDVMDVLVMKWPVYGMIVAIDASKVRAEIEKEDRALAEKLAALKERKIG